MSASDEFAVRYYRWALDDARREVQADFPLLRTVRSALPIRAVAYLEPFSETERLAKMTSLVKRSHRRAVSLTGDSWGAEDERVDEHYRDAARVRRPEEEWRYDAMLHDPAKLKINRRRFLAAVKAELDP